MYFSIVIWVICFQGISTAISVTFEPQKPALGDSVTITCTRTSSSTAITWEADSSTLTTCDGRICVPPPTGYTVSIDVAVNVFNLSVAAVTLTDCKTYTCKDSFNTSVTDSSDLQIAKYVSSETVLTEPGAHTSGTISVTSGCVLSPSDVTIEWKMVKQNGELTDLAASRSTDTTGCSDTCHAQTSVKIISSFTHTECTGSDCEEVTYRATIQHSSYSSVTLKDSAGYKVKAQILSSSLQHTEGDTVTLSCSLNGNYMFPEWRGPPSFTIYTFKDDASGQINPAAPAASRLSYASNDRDLLLTNAVVADSGEYKCLYYGLGDHTVTLTITEKALSSAMITIISSSSIATTTESPRTTNTIITSTTRSNSSGGTTGGSPSTCSCNPEVDATGMILAIIFGIVSAVLAVYAASLTILYRRKAMTKDASSTKKSTEKTTYVNLNVTECQGSQVEHKQDTTREVNGDNDDDDARQYTDLVRYSSNDDRTMYDVIQTTS